MKIKKFGILLAGLLVAGSVSVANAATGSLTVSDGSGNQLDDLSGATAVNAVLTIDGEFTPDADAKAYIAAYSGDTLVAIDDTAVQKSITFDTLTLPGSANQTLKAFCWQGD